jgi:hypothetical protein
MSIEVPQKNYKEGSARKVPRGIIADGRTAGDLPGPHSAQFALNSFHCGDLANS